MTDDDQKKKDPDPVEDLRAGLGLLFRAARGAVEKIPPVRIEELVKEGTDKVGKAFHRVPTDKVEEVVKESAKEIGHAFAHVAEAIGSSLTELAKPPKEEPKTDATRAGADGEKKQDEAPKDEPK